MAYAKQFIKLTFGGTMAAGQEIWTCGINLANEGAGVTELEFNSLTDPQIQSVADLIIAFVEDGDNNVPDGVFLDYVKLALIGTDGKYVGAPREVTGQLGQGGAVGGYVPQVATVVSMESGKYRDPGKYNRFYLPTATPAGSLEYQLTEGAAVLISNNAASLVSDIRDLDLLGVTKQLMPCAVTTANVENYLNIEKVRVGRVFDTQRRRRNKLNEQYQDTVVPPKV